MRASLDRRRLLIAGGACLLARPSVAETEPVALSWPMLIPPAERDVAADFLKAAGVGDRTDGLAGVVGHDMQFSQPTAEVGFVTEYDGRTVSLPGYVVPLDFTEEGTRVFLLVPFVGACIHVPPPPANQIVLVEAEAPYPLEDWFAAVSVTGVFSRLENTTTELAEVGYKIAAQAIETYEGPAAPL